MLTPQTPPSIEQHMPLWGLEPLYEMAGELNEVPETDQEKGEIYELLVPAIDEILSIMDMQLHPFGSSELGFDLGYVICTAGHSIIVCPDDNDKDSGTLYPQITDPDETLFVSGWLTGIRLGFDIAIEGHVIETIRDYRKGLWLDLSAAQPKTSNEPFNGAMVQIPDARLFNPHFTPN